MTYKFEQFKQSDGVHLPGVPVLNLEFQGEQNLLDTVTEYLNNNHVV